MPRSTSMWALARDVDFDALFRTLREMKFAEQTFKVGGAPIVAASLFGYPEKNEIPCSGNP